MVLSSRGVFRLRLRAVWIGFEATQTLLKAVRTELHVVQTLLQAVGTKV